MRILMLLICFLGISVFGRASLSLKVGDLQHFDQRKSSYKINIEELKVWDTIARELVYASSLALDQQARLFAYLYNAQEVFADGSFALTGGYFGSVSPISYHVLKLFFPEYEKPHMEAFKDHYSNELAERLAKKIDARFEEETQEIHPVEVEENENGWVGTEPYVGIEAPTMKPWLIKSRGEYRNFLPPPSEDPNYWKEQALLVKKSSLNLTQNQKERIKFWKEMGDFRVIAEDYMDRVNTPLEVRLEARAMLSSAILDATIALYDMKYTYMIKRPSMVNHTIKPLIPLPNDPSYPSAMSAIATAGEAILNFYFPENKKQWRTMSEEEGISLIWAGVNFPIDHIVGDLLGAMVGKTYLRMLGNLRRLRAATHVPKREVKIP